MPPMESLGGGSNDRDAPGSVRFVTFGCKANQYDTQVLREALGRRGLEETGPGADLVVVNTCTVTAEALMVMPRSRSRSIESSSWSRASRSETALVACSRRSARVLLPWSMWAMMEKLRTGKWGILAPRLDACHPMPGKPASFRLRI